MRIGDLGQRGEEDWEYDAFIDKEQEQSYGCYCCHWRSHYHLLWMSEPALICVVSVPVKPNTTLLWITHILCTTSLSTSSVVKEHKHQNHPDFYQDLPSLSTLGILVEHGWRMT